MREGWLKRGMAEGVHYTKLHQALDSMPSDNRSAFVLIGTDGTCIPLTRKEARTAAKIKREAPLRIYREKEG
jgi:hypothetical protein